MNNETNNATQQKIKLSIAVPAYNEAAGIAELMRSWHAYLQANELIQEFEIVICNDGSQDETGHILDELATIYSEIKIIHFKTNQGAASALTAAIAQTSLDWVLLMDADGQFLINNVLLLWQAIHASSAQVAMGVRHKKADLYARVGTALSGWVCNVIHRSKIRDFNSACKLVRGDLLRSLHLEAKGLNYSTEITSRLLEKNIAIVEVDIEHMPRQHGKSSMKLMRDTAHRFMFIVYLALRQGLLKWGILRRSG